MAIFRNVLVATDFSEYSEAAVTCARELAYQFGATLHVLHAVETGGLDFVGADSVLSNVSELRADLEAEARDELARVVTVGDRRDLRAVSVVKTLSTPAQAITDYAAAHDIDLIVVGTHGRRGISRVVMGSVAEKVVRMATCPVLTIRGAERPLVASKAWSQEDAHVHVFA